jgi:hypothetical protein
MNKRLLKLGEINGDVKELQRLLNLEPVDGIFGPITELAVMEFQEDHGLVIDGLVGNATWEALYATTDLTETFEFDNIEDQINEVYLPKDEYLKGPTTKRWLFLHHTAGWHNPYNTVNHWASDARGKIATEFVLGGQSIKGDDDTYDGKIIKCIPDGGYGWHLGIGNNAIHRESVGIECNNFGQLTKAGYYKTISGKRTWIAKEKDEFYTYVGTKADKSQIIQLEEQFRGFEYFHNYSDTQLEALHELILFICERDNIDPRKGLAKLIKEKGDFEAFNFLDKDYVAANPGIYCHTNVIYGKWDMYPHPKLIDILKSF